MSLSAGHKLGPYEIVAPIGRGGMGEVYRARDTRLNREVAIKLSAERFSERFDREARAVAALNHPNICTLHDVGPNYLVMELVEGESPRGPLPLETALNYARQIAEALEAAHEKGIVHRDLKPGNIKIRPDGTVKVLDFGLAKMGGTPTASTDHSPTVAMDHTEAGVILGTASYMSPEQAKGKPVDQRADIYAFGVVLYEMLSGSKLHQGESNTEVLASVIKEEPQWDKVPPQVQRLLRRCLEKDPQKRLRHIGDVMALVDDAPRVTAEVPRASAATRRWLWPSAAAALVAVAGIAFWAPWRAEPNVQPVRFEIPPVEKMTFVPGGAPALSPDGRWVVLPGTGSDGVTRMWLRALDSVEVRPLTGTEVGNALPPPVYWSPDSRYIAFSSNPAPFAPGQLKKLAVSGGPAQTVCDIPGGVIGATWNRDGVIVFATNVGDRGLRRVSATGGVSTPVTVPDASRRENAHFWPQFLPDGNHFLYLRVSNDPQFMGVYVGSLNAKPEEQITKPVLLTNRQAVYAAPQRSGPGRLLFLRDTTLFAQSFDPGRLELSGEAVPIADQVGSFAGANYGLFSVSETGVLSYRVGAGGTLQQLTWFDRQGKALGTLGDRAAYATPTVSSDGTRVAITQFDAQSGNSNIWVLDVTRGTSTKVTFNTGRNDNPVWSPDGKRIAFASNREGRMDLYQKNADGSGEDELLLKSDEDKFPTSWSQDGHFMLYTAVNTKTQEDIWVLALADRKARAFLRNDARESQGAFSPDGHWIAYASIESGNQEVYVRPFSADKGEPSVTGGKWLVSKGGGGNPRWRADGKELLYFSQALQQFAVDVRTTTTFQAGIPKLLFTSTPQVTRPHGTADGLRFLFATPEGVATGTPFTVVTNWQAALKK